jgi:ParB family chromosome partitioning protein
MSAQLALNLSDEINVLHERLTGLARTSLETAIKIGELLTRQKAELKHGEFIPWCRKNLRFDYSQATRYMKVWRERSNIELSQDFTFSEFYRIISQQAEEPQEEEPDRRDDYYLADLAEEEPEPEPEPITPVLETPEQKAAAWDLAEELAEQEGTPVTQKHIQQATEAVSTVPATEEDGTISEAEEVKEKAKKHVHVAQNSGENEWYTPPNFIASARAVMGGIDTDPASSEIANNTVKAKRFYTKEDDGLRQTWKGNVWMNPPYAQPLISNFAEAVAYKYSAGEFKQAIVLVNNATETQWFQRMAGVASAICFPKSRVRFLDPQGNPGAPLQGQAILYFGKNPAKFAEEFNQYGATFS